MSTAACGTFWQWIPAFAGMTLLGAGMTVVPASAHAIPRFVEVKAAHRPSDITLLDRHGTPIQTVRIDKTVRRLPWVPLRDVSPALLTAIVLSEDKRFHEHSGVDWSRWRKAPGRTCGTRAHAVPPPLTMQLAVCSTTISRGGRRAQRGAEVSQAFTATRLDAQ